MLGRGSMPPRWSSGWPTVDALRQQDHARTSAPEGHQEQATHASIHRGDGQLFSARSHP